MASERTKIREEFAEELEEDRPLTKEELRHEIISTIVYLLVVFVLIFLFIHYVGQRTVVSGSSMENTLSNGDNLIIDKISYRFRDPERFEVVVCEGTQTQILGLRKVRLPSAFWMKYRIIFSVIV